MRRHTRVGPDALVWAAQRTRQSEHAPCVATAHVGPDALVWAAEQSSATSSTIVNRRIRRAREGTRPT